MLSKQFDFRASEQSIYERWEQSNAFQPKDSDHDSQAFCIAMPPPNANGSLHVGHASMLAYEDIMIRYHRMKGDATLWIPGTDHAGIQTQAVFERYLQDQQNKTRHDLGRTEFYKQCFNFCMDNKNTITGQIRTMGASCDWTREKFTLDPELLDVVFDTFIQMYNDDLVYRAERIIQWCPRCGTSLSDIEVIHEETPSKLYYIKYGPLTLATVRPETKFGDTALAVHPDDLRYQKYIGKTLTVESVLDEPIEIIVLADEAVDPEFGTGVIKVTPAHDPLDFEIGQRHDLEIRQVIDKEGKLNKHAGKFAGRVAREARKDIANDLQKKGLLEKVEDYVSPVSVCERCQTPVEPLISLQWWIKMKEMANRAISVVHRGEVDILPKRFEKEFFHWLENIRDWNISRQIWWGPQLPIWYCEDCEEVLVQKELPTSCTKCQSTNLKQDPDTFDTWFSSAQWPFSILGGPGKKEFSRFYPTNVMETGWDILFFWVARMLMVGLYRTEKIPFHTVYLHGLILDKEGRKMSKSKGNVIDPLEMIQKYGADALRLSMVSGTTPGHDVRLYDEKIASFRNFTTKLWNVGRYIESQEGDDLSFRTSKPRLVTDADYWITSKLQHLIDRVTTTLESYQFGQAIDLIYSFLWHDFADWYIEISKIQLDEQYDSLSVYNNETLGILHYVYRTILQLLHPAAPFITEALWQHFEYGGMLISAPWPKDESSLRFEQKETRFQFLKEVISAIRERRSLYSLPSSQKLRLVHSSESHTSQLQDALALLEKFVSVTSVECAEEMPSSSLAFVVLGVAFRIPLEGADISKIQTEIEKELKRDESVLSSLQKKLQDRKFLENAPASIVSGTKKKFELREKDYKYRKNALQDLQS